MHQSIQSGTCSKYIHVHAYVYTCTYLSEIRIYVHVRMYITLRNIHVLMMIPCGLLNCYCAIHQMFPPTCIYYAHVHIFIQTSLPVPVAKLDFPANLLQ